MPTLTPADQVGLHISTLKSSQLLLYSSNTAGRHPFPLAVLIRQVVSDRLVLAGDRLGDGDRLILAKNYRSAISRHYYAMYHAARAIVFAEEKGDDHEKHNVLPRHLPPSMSNVGQYENELTNARLLRNQADYDIYPSGDAAWEVEARSLAVIAAGFVNAFEHFALTNGYV
ncbi:HEPN domain-containing protein [Nocardia brasiliensis]|uniref:HEPN domain-containing protein n=1 Tax=Nocardia brasiliensis TaxID=37326 RepID=UPI002453BAF2|nr:HEPN domain-containing protein [Nocardia brasiliensis]